MPPGWQLWLPDEDLSVTPGLNGRHSRPRRAFSGNNHLGEPADGLSPLPPDGAVERHPSWPGGPPQAWPPQGGLSPQWPPPDSAPAWPPHDGPLLDGQLLDGQLLDGPPLDGAPLDGRPLDGPELDGPPFDGPAFGGAAFGGAAFGRPAQAWPPDGTQSWAVRGGAAHVGPGHDGAGHDGPGQDWQPQDWQGQNQQGQNQQGQGQQGQGQQPGSRGKPAYNILAITAFVLSFLGGWLAIVFGIMALAQIRRRGERGRGLAIAALGIAGAWILLLAVLIVVGATTKSQIQPPSASGPGTSRNVFSLHVGDCFQNPPGNHIGSLASVAVTSCTTPHNAQVFAQFKATDKRYPGATALIREADRGCSQRVAGGLDQAKLTKAIALHFIYPLASSWSSGQRVISCLAVDASPSLTSSLLPSGHG